MKSLFKRYPKLCGKIPYLPLGEFPTPILGPLEFQGSRIWIKGDHLASSVHGGNKVRKLEIALAMAKERGAQEILLGGAMGSNWCVAGVIFGKALNFFTHCLLFPQPPSEIRTVNYKFLQTHADKTTHLIHPLLLPPALRWFQSPKTYPLPLGGTSPETTLGYVNAAWELLDQMEEGIIEKPDEIWLPLGTGGTAAGLLLGLEMAHRKDIALHLVRVVDLPLANLWRVRWLAYQARRLLEKLLKQSIPVQPIPIKIHHSAFGKGYGYPTKEGQKAISFFQNHFSLKLETTYTAKAAAMLLKSLNHRKNRKILFWNTYNSQPLPN
ncbi:MAG: pyridoxal-phosphate dependent enzyme [Planctomycetota bacterium]|nr:MAG: pyridoxal-phosphate dependent enzyme [Planctomycetota bacterium]